MATRAKAKEEEVVEEVESCDNTTRDLEADAIIKNHMMVSLGFGVVPMPIVDLVGLTATQINMLRKLSNLYGHTFSEEWAKKSIGALVTSGLALPVAMGVSSIIKFVPVLGQTAGIIALGTTGAASTYAIGRVFVKHFESGGDFLSFSSKDAKKAFKEEFEKGKETASEIKKDEKAA